MKITKRDTGYAWVILGACFANNLLSCILFLTPAVYMIEWQEYFNTSKTEVTIISSIAASTGCLIALVLGPIINRFGCRPLTITGTTLAFAGGVCSCFAPSVYWLYITYGLMCGIGQGMIFFPPYIIIQYYFDKKRAFAAGIAVTGRSIGGMVILPIIQLIIDAYGWRGALLIQSAVLLNLYAVALLYVTPNIPELQTSNQTGKKTQQTKSTYITLLRNFVFVRFLIGVLISNFSTDYMYKFTPLKAVSMGLDRVQAALLPSFGGLVTAITRIPVSVMANMKCVNRTLLMAVSYTGVGVVVIMCSLAWNFPSFSVFMCMWGVFYSISTTIETTTMVDLIGVENVAVGQSYNLGGTGVVLIASLSMAGVIADNTNNLNITNYIYGSLSLLSGILLFSIALPRMCKSRETVTEDEGKDETKQFNDEQSLQDEPVT